MNLLSNAVLRGAEIRRRRSADLRLAVFTSVFQTQILFWAWVIGWQFGPATLMIEEIAKGALLTLALGFVSSWLGLRRHLERTALAKLKVLVDGRRRRLVLFVDHLGLGDELIVRSEISTFEASQDFVTIKFNPSDGSEEKQCRMDGEASALVRLNSYLTEVQNS
jgi:hypothetical protein